MTKCVESSGMIARTVLIASFLFTLIYVFPVTANAETKTSIEDLKAGVVKITSNVGGKRQMGTGIIVNLEIDTVYILTASHVIEGDQEPQVTFYSDPNEPFTAKTVALEGGDPKGLAVLRIRIKGRLPSGLRALYLDEKATINGGEQVMLIGFPRSIGTQWAVTTGTLAGQKGRDLTFSGAADGGNSGGPLLIEGKVVGVVTEKLGNFGYATPILTALYALKGWGVQANLTMADRKMQMLDTLNTQPEEKTYPVQEARVRPNDAPTRLAKEITGKDGAPMVLVQAGAFTMGSLKGVSNSNEHPQHFVSVNAFYLDTHEVTNRQFQQFVQANRYRTTAEQEGKAYGLTSQGEQKHISGASWRQPEGEESVFASERELHPVVAISWEDAKAYCTGVGKRLPTEAEWEYAARAGTTTNYWWGQEFPPSSKLVGNTADKSAKEKFGWSRAKDTYDDGYVRTAPVGSFKANPWGLYDMSGNVWEWVEDWYGEDYYQSSPNENPKGPERGEQKVLRGGSWNYGPSSLRSAIRGRDFPSKRNAYFGVRCAQDAP